ncbi:MAG: hypothetical protein ACYDCJ_12395 [Gammaproteobacteria bacterium]
MTKQTIAREAAIAAARAELSRTCNPALLARDDAISAAHAAYDSIFARASAAYDAALEAAHEAYKAALDVANEKEGPNA